MNLGGQEIRLFVSGLAMVLMLVASVSFCIPVFALESTMPSQYWEKMNPEVAKQYVYSENGEFSAACGLPTYQWLPANGDIKAVFIGIHGLTLHGRRYRVLARTLAINNMAFVAMDMRGFGSCKFEEDGREKPKGETTSINHEKSYQDIVKLIQSVRIKYPNAPIIALGESLGCTFCLRLAGEHPELVSGLVLSAPAVRVNPKMYATPTDIKEGLKAIVSPHHQVNLHAFFTELVSSRPEVVKEMIEDPFILKSLSIGDLLETDFFVDKTVEWSKNAAPNLPLLVLQGSNDKCVLPKHLTDLMMHMKSDDMRIAWKGTYGHLQLETMFMRAPIIDSIAMWLHDHSRESSAKLRRLEQSIADLGGTLLN